jgi:hypothetical protein
MEELFFDAVLNGKDEEARKILKENPLIDINWKDEGYNGYTALHCACINGSDTVVSLLLAHPDIEINQSDWEGDSSFLLACANGKASCVRLLLKDPRVKPNEPDNGGSTPLYYVARDGYPDVIRWWIASGRGVDLGEPGNEKNDAIGEAKKIESWMDEDQKKRKTEVTTLLERFRDHPEETRHEVRVELGWFDEVAAEIFALVVFLCDGLFTFRKENTTGAVKFFQIASCLPMEIQMIPCYRVVGSMGENIPGDQREAAFRALARQL